MVNTATDQVGGNNGAGGTNANIPTQIQGWGRINLGNVVDGTAASSSTRRRASPRPVRRGPTRSTRSPTLGEPLKVTLAWTDAPGPPDRKRLRQRPRPRRPRRWRQLQGQRLRRRRVGDRGLGRSAQQRRERLPAGRDERPLRGRRAGDQHRRRRGSRQRRHDRSGLRARGLQREPVERTDPRPRPCATDDRDRRRRRQDRARRAVPPARAAAGTSAPGRQRGSAATLSAAAPGITVPAPSSAYPNIAANATAFNTTPFRVRLAPTFACGATARLSLDVTTGQGNFQIPITFRPAVDRVRR